MMEPRYMHVHIYAIFYKQNYYMYYYEHRWKQQKWNKIMKYALRLNFGMCSQPKIALIERMGKKKENKGQEYNVSVQVPGVLLWANALFPSQQSSPITWCVVLWYHSK